MTLILECMAWIVVVGRLLVVPVFAWRGVNSLSLSGIASPLIWAAALVVAQKGYYNAGFLLGFLEVLAEVFLGVTILGWGSGIQYYLLTLLLFVLIYPARHDATRLITPILLCSLYVMLNLYSGRVTPVVVLDPAAHQLLSSLNTVAVFLGLSVFAYRYGTAVRMVEQRLREANVRLDLLAATDPLTKLLNRRGIRRRIEAEMGRLRRDGNAFALVMSDVDDFKSFNDRHGHDCGDFTLVTIADSVSGCLRKRDRVARWGGEEFLLLLPDTNLEEAGAAAEGIRAMVERSSVLYEGNEVSITMTFGVTVCDSPESIDECIKRADRALYAAKREGRNRVALAKGVSAQE